jgi:hypothetical protein
MVEIIAADFGVEVVTQNNQNSFLAAPKGVLFHFVFFQKQSGYNEIKQFYIHRYEVASWLCNAIDSNTNTKHFSLAGGHIQIALNFDAGKPFLQITFNEVNYSISLMDSDIGKILKSDSEIYSKIYLESSEQEFIKKITTAILEEYDENKNYPFSPSSLKIAAFELKILKTKKSWKKDSYYSKLLDYQYSDSKDLDYSLVYNLMNSLQIVVGKSECDCGSEGCFFDLLHKAYTTFFTEDDLLTDSKLDQEKVSIQLTKIWNNLDSKSRAVMNFLDCEFGNTPLINLYLLTENADFEEYIYKMTYPYQPDSEDDAFVRMIVSCVKVYLT